MALEASESDGPLNKPNLTDGAWKLILGSFRDLCFTEQA